MRRDLLAVVTLVALVLRAYPLHVFYLHPDQEQPPRAAMQMLLAADWRPPHLANPTGLVYTLRLAYTAVYRVGRAFGVFRDKVDLLAAFVERPFPFYVLARAWSCVTGVLTVVLTACLGAQLFGGPAGLLSGLFVAVSFLHVRESHYTWFDAPGVACATGALLAAIVHRTNGRAWPLVLAGLLAGLATGHRYQLVVVFLVLPTAALTRGRARRALLPLAGAMAAGAAAFALLSPYSFLEFSRASHDVRTQLAVSYWRPQPEALPFGTILSAAVGVPLCGLALIGLAAALRRCPGDVAVLLVPIVPYTASVLLAPRLFARYAVPLVPELAVLAAAGVTSLTARMEGRRARIVGVLLVLVAIADPLVRSVQFDRVLAREDTRWAAGRWIVDHVPDHASLIRPGSGWYSNPELPPTAGDVAFDFGAAWAEQLVERGRLRGVRAYRMIDYGLDGNGIDWTRPPARWVVTSEHPGLPVFGMVPTEMSRFLAAHAVPVARFIGYPDDGALFDPIDANYVPLRGFGSVRSPGPNIVVWQLAAGPG
ncbi:MAG TPA: glycosyltransferase family 39 protein [Candidatus Nitrosopolaris sp.]|nr:glycosyltransferase family 39 protein [Candidatus Nitrosopolaris sp.]